MIGITKILWLLITREYLSNSAKSQNGAHVWPHANSNHNNNNNNNQTKKKKLINPQNQCDAMPTARSSSPRTITEEERASEREREHNFH